MDVCIQIKWISSLVTRLIVNHKAKGTGGSYRLLRAAIRSSKRRAPRRGHVLVHVGEDREGKKYEVPLKYLSFPEMVTLMRRQGEEHLEEKIDGPLRAYCCTQVFEELVSRLDVVRDQDHL